MDEGSIAALVICLIFGPILLYGAYKYFQEHKQKNKYATMRNQKESNQSELPEIVTNPLQNHLHLKSPIQFQDFSTDDTSNLKNRFSTPPHSPILDDIPSEIKTIMSPGSEVLSPFHIPLNTPPNRRLFDESVQIDETVENIEYENVSLDGIVKAGYLFKKSTNIRKDWLKRYFFIRQGKLFYVKSHLDLVNKTQIQAILVANLLISTIKQGGGQLGVNQNIFQIISPGTRGSDRGGGLYELKCDNEIVAKDWVDFIRQQIEGSLVNSTNVASGSNRTDDVESIEFLPDTNLLIDLQYANPYCADCNSADPQWVSLNLGIMICIECSGIHRSLGTHISKVRSLTLDKWSPYSIQLLLYFGNKNSNNIWEELPMALEKKPNANSDREVKELFIRDKYVKKMYLRIPDTIDVKKLLYEGCKRKSVNMMMKAIAFGVDINSMIIDENIRKTLLHITVENNFILGVEILQKSNVDIDAVDENNKTAVAIATERNYLEIVQLFKNCQQHLKVTSIMS